MYFIYYSLMQLDEFKFSRWMYNWFIHSSSVTTSYTSFSQGLIYRVHFKHVYYINVVYKKSQFDKIHPF